MTKTFTRNDVIRYIYDEMTNEESTKFRNILKVDSELREDCQAELHIKDRLNKTLIHPPTRIVDALLDYSSLSQLRETNVTG